MGITVRENMEGRMLTQFVVLSYLVMHYSSIFNLIIPSMSNHKNYIKISKVKDQTCVHMKTKADVRSADIFLHSNCTWIDDY